MAYMSLPPENPLTFHSLYDSSVVKVRYYSCQAGRGGPSAEEQSGSNDIVLMGHGIFCKHFGRRSVTADVDQAVFFSKGSTYRVSHPADCGDRGTVFTPSPSVLNDIVREFDPSVDDRPDQPFPFITSPCDSRVYWRHHQLVQQLKIAEACPLEPIWVDATALQIVVDTLEAAFAHYGKPLKPRRNSTSADHAERAEAAKTYLTSRLSERITLDEVARAVHVSPFHFARLFRRHTGLSVHRYLTQLRLRASLERLTGGAKDLTRLALELGFSSHSHFTDVFRNEFGRSPSEVRREASLRKLGEMSKNLEV
jgi:AraC family transcriptional regulator